MAKNILVVIDMQKDFIDGALGSKEAVSIVPNVVEKVKNFEGMVIYTKDTHTEDYMNTMEGKKLPVPHCIKGTEGHEICDELKPFITSDEQVVEKPTFGSVELATRLKTIYDSEGIDSVTFVGVCTDICVVSNALLVKAYMPELDIKAQADCMAGVTKELHDMAIGVMKSCHIDII